MTRTHTVITALFLSSFASIGLAAGSDDTQPPVATETTEKCTSGDDQENSNRCIGRARGLPHIPGALNYSEGRLSH